MRLLSRRMSILTLFVCFYWQTIKITRLHYEKWGKNIHTNPESTSIILYYKVEDNDEILGGL